MDKRKHVASDKEQRRGRKLKEQRMYRLLRVSTIRAGRHVGATEVFYACQMRVLVSDLTLNSLHRPTPVLSTHFRVEHRIRTRLIPFRFSDTTSIMQAFRSTVRYIALDNANKWFRSIVDCRACAGDRDIASTGKPYFGSSSPL